jgi:hypothetical protein
MYMKKIFEQSLLYIAHILFYIEDTNFFLPLEQIMKNTE